MKNKLFIFGTVILAAVFLIAACGQQPIANGCPDTGLRGAMVLKANLAVNTIQADNAKTCAQIDKAALTTARDNMQEASTYFTSYCDAKCNPNDSVCAGLSTGQGAVTLANNILARC